MFQSHLQASSLGLSAVIVFELDINIHLKTLPISLTVHCSDDKCIGSKGFKAQPFDATQGREPVERLRAKSYYREKR